MLEQYIELLQTLAQARDVQAVLVVVVVGLVLVIVALWRQLWKCEDES